jgi:hypothetical protein
MDNFMYSMKQYESFFLKKSKTNKYILRNHIKSKRRIRWLIDIDTYLGTSSSYKAYTAGRHRDTRDHQNLGEGGHTHVSVYEFHFHMWQNSLPKRTTNSKLHVLEKKQCSTEDHQRKNASKGFVLKLVTRWLSILPMHWTPAMAGQSSVTTRRHWWRKDSFPEHVSVTTSRSSALSYVPFVKAANKKI